MVRYLILVLIVCMLVTEARSQLVFEKKEYATRREMYLV